MSRQQLTNWKVKGYWPYYPMLKKGMELGNELMGVTDWIDAEVPGSIHMDLLNAGLIEDPYFEKNSLMCEWVPNRWWVYTTAFTIDEDNYSKQIFLVFKGIDYKAHIYLNDIKINEHTGMYTVCRTDITNHYIKGKENILKVFIESAPDEMGQIGFTYNTHTQKARFGYKWDFSTRLINLGLYDEVFLEYNDGVKLTDQKISYANGIVTVEATTEMTASDTATLYAEISYLGTLIDKKSKDISAGGTVCFELTVENPLLWWPNGYGAQPLYDIKISAYNHRGMLSDEYIQRYGLRTLDFDKCEKASDDSLPYRIFINSEPIYIKGVNITPLDHMYGIVDEKRYDTFLKGIRDCNINLVRVWGGGIIEKEAFYNLCDKYGIMVWQEFIQSSSGLSNEPSKLPDFMELCAKTVECAVKEKRNHVSLTIWGGGNELMYDGEIPITYDDANISMIKRIVEKYDTEHLFLPSSPSGPNAWNDTENICNNHDIHGLWKYMGPVNHYTCYNAMRCQLHSEFGNDGMGNLESLKKVMSPKNLDKVYTVYNNPVWAHHGDWWDTYEYRDKLIFGEITDIEEFITLSQYMQAEGLRYSLESHRRKAFINAGAIIWQYNEPWVNISCTSIVDYYNKPKFAYYFVRDAFSPYHISLSYEKLIYNQNDTFSGTVYVHDELESSSTDGIIRLLDSKRNIIKEYPLSCRTKKGYAVKAIDIEFNLDGIDDFFYVECNITSGTRANKNEYLFFITDKQHPYAKRTAVIDFVNGYLSDR